MDIIFVSATCDKEYYNYICENRIKPCLDPSQKFFDIFLNGLNECKNINVDCITIAPISKSTYPKKYIAGHENVVGRIKYHYVPLYNRIGIKTLCAIKSLIKLIKKTLNKKNNINETVIICDALSLESLIATNVTGKKYNIKTVSFLTDLPEFAVECDRMSAFKSILYRLYNKKIYKNIRKNDAFIFLAEPMKFLAKNKPWMLLDCFVDPNTLNNIVPLIHSDNLPHIVYCGKVHLEVGLDILCKAIENVKTDCIFDVYGDGNYMEELKSFAKNHSNLIIHGIVPVDEALSAELSASILINPRPARGEFTKFSFPSKTAEYLLTGIPIVMFRLPGISSKYESYIQYADADNPESLAKKIDEVLNLDFEERKKMGLRSKQYIIDNNNNIVQAKKVIDFIKSL